MHGQQNIKNWERHNIVFVCFSLETAVQEQLYIYIYNHRKKLISLVVQALGRGSFFVAVNEYFNHKIQLYDEF